MEALAEGKTLSEIAGQHGVHPAQGGNALAANHYMIAMIARGRGILTIPKEEVPAFNRALVAFYEGEDYAAFKAYAWEHCIQGMSRDG